MAKKNKTNVVKVIRPTSTIDKNTKPEVDTKDIVKEKVTEVSEKPEEVKEVPVVEESPMIENEPVEPDAKEIKEEVPVQEEETPGIIEDTKVEETEKEEIPVVPVENIKMNIENKGQTGEWFPINSLGQFIGSSIEDGVCFEKYYVLYSGEYTKKTYDFETVKTRSGRVNVDVSLDNTDNSIYSGPFDTPTDAIGIRKLMLAVGIVGEICGFRGIVTDGKLSGYVKIR